VQLCTGGTWIGVTHAAQDPNTFKLITGEPMAADMRRCEPVYSSRSAAPNFEFIDAQQLQRLLPKTSKLHALRGLLPQRGKAQVVLGMEGGSDGRASVGVVTGRRWLWQANVASTLSEHATLLDPALAAVRLERVVVPYIAPNSSVRLVSYDLKDGRRIWSQALDGAHLEGAKSEAQLLVSLDGHLLFGGAGKLWAVKLTDGTKVWSIGGP
jgi:hypothetical protein